MARTDFGAVGTPNQRLDFRRVRRISGPLFPQDWFLAKYGTKMPGCSSRNISFVPSHGCHRTEASVSSQVFLEEHICQIRSPSSQDRCLAGVLPATATAVVAATRGGVRCGILDNATLVERATGRNVLATTYLTHQTI
jgi:hypothetical protein